jgi:hypothetical protein
MTRGAGGVLCITHDFLQKVPSCEQIGQSAGWAKDLKRTHRQIPDMRIKLRSVFAREKYTILDAICVVIPQEVGHERPPEALAPMFFRDVEIGDPRIFAHGDAAYPSVNGFAGDRGVKPLRCIVHSKIFVLYFSAAVCLVVEFGVRDLDD